MCDVKPDLDNPGICRGCLSTNRKLSTVASLDLYSLLREDQKMEALRVPNIALCWECLAFLQRTQRFLVQVQRAHDILQDSLHLSPTKPTLSLLTFHKKIEYDAVFEESKPAEQPLISETKNLAINYEKVIIPTKYKAKFPANNENGKTEYFSDYEDYDNFDCDEGSFSSSTDKRDIGVMNDSLPVINKAKQKYTLKEDGKQETPKPKAVKRIIENNKTNPEEEPSRKFSPLTKTPAMLNVELQLKKFIQLRATAKKSDKGNKVTKVISKLHADRNATNNDECKKTTKHQKTTELEDPDFTLEDNDKDYASDDSEEFKGVPLKKTKRQSDENPNSDVEDDNDNTRDKNRKFKKTVTRYQNITDVFPYFTKSEMNQQDLKRVLDEDDAIVDKNKPYKCNICGKRCMQVKHIQTHAIMYHKKEYPNYFQNIRFQNPPLVMPKKFVWQCHICKRMMRQEHVVVHMNEYHRLQYTCNIDGCEWWKELFCFRTKQDFDQHYESIHKAHTCDICQISKKKKMHLATHMQEAHACVGKPTSFKCRYCPKVYNKRRSCQQHEYTTHKPPEPEELRYCVECNVTFKRIAIFQYHFRNKHSGPKPKWTCEKCGKVLSTKSSYLVHVDFAHGGQAKYRCHICGKCFAKNCSLKAHLDRHNNTSKPIPKNKACPVCGHRFQYSASLRLHMYTHTGERPYQCPQPHCEVAYNQPHCLAVHLKKRHGIIASVRFSGKIVLAPPTSESKTGEQQN